MTALGIDLTQLEIDQAHVDAMTASLAALADEAERAANALASVGRLTAAQDEEAQ